MSGFPRIDCVVRFLATESGGRSTMPKLSGNVYRPHLIVQREGQTHLTGDDYLGVLFESGPDDACFDADCRVTLVLVYHPEVDYSALAPGASFKIYEGSRIVGVGKVERV